MSEGPKNWEELSGAILRKLLAKLSMILLLCGFIDAPNPLVRSEDGKLGADLELILAVDTSGSMNSSRLLMQRNGYINAFRRMDLMESIEAGQLGRISILYMEWAGPGHQVIVVPWTIIDEPADAIAFAEMLATQPLSQPAKSHTGTSLSGALLFAEGLFRGQQFERTRRVIDISGDGPNNSGMPVAPVRDALAAHGITINGLPIALRHNEGHIAISSLNPVALQAYFANCVIGGPGAFTVVVDDIAQFDTSIRRKLQMEILAQQPQFTLAHSKAISGSTFDCSAIGDNPGR
jgi:hypothetical protein